MLKKPSVLVFLFILLSFNHIFSQVNSVNYHIRYNESTCLYDCCLIVMSGSATSPIQRAQFGSQYSIVVPTGTQVQIAQLHNPIQNNQFYNGTVPCVWNINSSITSPGAQPESDFHSVTPSNSPSSFYNNLSTGDTVVLFSLSLSPMINCAQGVRVFDNETDPAANAEGMGGGDFTNGFTLGGISNKYNANSPSILPSQPDVLSLTSSCATGLNINLNATANTCQAPLSYLWSGPDGFSSSLQNVALQNPGPLNSGLYTVTISDALGCKDTVSIQAYAKPEAGPSQLVSCFQSGTATIHAVGSGVWSIGVGSAGTATIAQPNNAITTVTGFTAAGVYNLVWSANGCSDTTTVTAGSDCACNLNNSLVLPTVQSFCNSSGALTLIGSDLSSATGTYQWIYRLNNQPYVNAPGTSTNKDYQITNLNIGAHSFRRIFIKSIAPFCRDTSNIVSLQVLAMPNAGANINLNCYETDTAFLQAVNTGFWSIGASSAGIATLSSLTNPNATVTNFSQSGVYYLIWSNNVCSDTTLITADIFCGCDVANGGANRNVCVGGQSELIGTCALGIWRSMVSNPVGATLDSIGPGQSLVQFSTQASGMYRFIFSINEALSDTISILIVPNPIISAGEDFGYCEELGLVTITASGGASYLWSTGQTSTSINVEPDTTTTYHVTGYNADGCSRTDSVTVTIFQRPSGVIPPIDPMYEKETLQLYAGDWSDGLMYLWTGPNNFTSATRNPVIPNVSMVNSGMYTLMVTSPEDCVAYGSVNVQILESPLPIELKDFGGSYNPKTKSNDLIWNTLTEANSHYFSIERSINGQQWIEVGNINANGSSTVVKSYSFEDTNIKKGQTYFYRLRSVDYDGSFQFSNIIEISVPSDFTFLTSLYPNPATDHVNLKIEGLIDGDIEIQIYSTSGQNWFHNVLSSVSYEGQGNIQIPVYQLPNGVYQVVITTGVVTARHKLIIMK